MKKKPPQPSHLKMIGDEMMNPTKPTDDLLIQLEEVHKILEDPSKTRWRASSEASEKLQLIIDKRKAGLL